MPPKKKQRKAAAPAAEDHTEDAALEEHPSSPGPPVARPEHISAESVSQSMSEVEFEVARSSKARGRSQKLLFQLEDEEDVAEWFQPQELFYNKHLKDP